jgi:hypothetical protein
MGQAFDRDGSVLGEAFGATKREVFEALNAQFKDAERIEIRTLREKLESPRTDDAVDPVGEQVTSGPRAPESSSLSLDLAALQQQVAALTQERDETEAARLELHQQGQGFRVSLIQRAETAERALTQLREGLQTLIVEVNATARHAAQDDNDQFARACRWCLDQLTALLAATDGKD